MLVAISGSQGSGKSTILNELARLGHNVVQQKTARSILAEWDVTLPEVNASEKLTTEFQMEILLRKAGDELPAVESDDLWFTERTYADLFTYAVVSLGKNNAFNDWLNMYYHSCRTYSQAYYERVVYIAAGHFAPVYDGVRGANVHYSRMVDITMLDITKQMVDSTKLQILDRPNLDERIQLIIQYGQETE